jgi:hypothetical protein
LPLILKITDSFCFPCNYRATVDSQGRGAMGRAADGSILDFGAGSSGLPDFGGEATNVNGLDGAIRGGTIVTEQQGHGAGRPSYC